MTVSLEHIRDKLLPSYSDLEQVDDNVLRFERRSHGRSYAVCYLDVSANIPETVDALDAYQDKIVARRYFDGSKSLQWSNYLYFIVDTQPSQKIRAIVERDRKYARKFIITELELDAALAPPSFQVSDSLVKTDVLAKWTDILAGANLDRAVLNSESLPRRIELIEASFGQGAVAIPAAVSSPRPSKQPFLRHIKLQTFREYPLQREFDLGTVTLFCGANGTGKTSLLEAIELLYCGRTKRNPSDSGTYSISAKFEGGKTEIANNRRPLSVYRDRNLAWYGQSEQRTNTLFQTFSRFNFLDTDAAVGLAEEKDNFEEDLSKLLVGPDASKTWREIERTAGKLDDNVKELDAVRNQVELEQASLDRQIAASGGLKQESNAVLAKLDELLGKLSWTRDGNDPTLSVNKLVESLSECDSLIQEAIDFDWAGAPATLGKLRDFVQKSKARIAASDKLVQTIADARASESRLSRELTRVEKTLAEVSELSQLMESGLPERIAELARVAPAISKYRQIVAGFDETHMQPHLLNAAMLTVSDFSKSAAERLKSARTSLDAARKNYSEFSALRNESDNLVQQLREVASRLLEKASEPDTCPLCHTKFSAGELAEHMHTGVDPQLEQRAMTLLGAIREHEASIEELAATQSTASWAELACQRLGEPVSIAVSRLMTILAEGQKEYASLIEAHKRCTDELAEMQKAGLTEERYRNALTRVSTNLQSASLEQVNGERAKLEQERSQKIAERDIYKNAVQEALQLLQSALAITDASVDVDSALAQVKERLAATEGLLARLKPYVDQYPWPADRPLSDVAITIGLARRLAGDYQATFSKEQSEVKMLAEATSRKAQIKKQLDGLLPRIDRLKEARDVLTKIQVEHSLSGAMEDALRQNRNAIEAIFARIHSPAEFSGLGDKLTTLIRKNGAGTATLQQISTGQRAALALSLFLAQNAQLRTAPPLLLIDDPIAHIDDLNSLSFLDYLREVVVAGDRQVIFSTADDKLAMLFERKFEFLGDTEFRRYDLSR